MADMDGDVERRNLREFLEAGKGMVITDSFQNRKRREGILRQLIESQFKKEDKDRVFSQAQRRILWNLDRKHLCSYLFTGLTDL